MNNAENHLLELGREIFDKSHNILEEVKRWMEISRLKLIPVAKILVSEFKEELSGILIQIMNTGKNYILRASLSNANHSVRLIRGTKSVLSLNDSSLLRKKQNIINSLKIYLKNISSRISVFDNSLMILDPENVLKRGYTITSLNGKIIKNQNLLRKDDLIDTRFCDGTVSSKVV
jgi:exodeoxyribonuclease VII large subunit